MERRQQAQQARQAAPAQQPGQQRPRRGPQQERTQQERAQQEQQQQQQCCDGAAAADAALCSDLLGIVRREGGVVLALALHALHIWSQGSAERTETCLRQGVVPLLLQVRRAGAGTGKGEGGARGRGAEGRGGVRHTGAAWLHDYCSAIACVA